MLDAGLSGLVEWAGMGCSVERIEVGGLGLGYSGLGFVDEVCQWFRCWSVAIWSIGGFCGAVGLGLCLLVGFGLIWLLLVGRLVYGLWMLDSGANGYMI
ncbi:unnamed protein product, partial [Ilex paraguariensis]